MVAVEGRCVMADAGVLELVDVSALAGLDWQPVCEWRGNGAEGCGREAVWAGVTSCCGACLFRCEEHKRLLEELLLRGPSDERKQWVCRRCSHSMQVRWEPLGGGGR